ncbi:SLAIN motif-containing protein-like [Hippocampus zosterae]|uniref:SLAIN motif-containing protein-like n=1 Tax=Hippocampus zosterae TaxID=109293 RepID=UPI00223E186B|nr:SLAIN motif-containing protein-like [Hippocampus zosterae]
MDVQDLTIRNWSLNFNDVIKSNHPVFQAEGKSDPQPSLWADPKRVTSCISRSFARDARTRLDFLKFGSNSQVSSGAKDGMMLNDEKEKDPGTDTVLDLVELLELKDDKEDDESWLYKSPKRQMSADNESPLKWCRHVLDNPSPETEAASRFLLDKLNQKTSRSYRSMFYRQPPVQDRTDSAFVELQNDTSNSSDNCDLGVPVESVTTSYKLQDITDVHLMARIQEDSLRHDYISMPASVSDRRSPEPQVRLRQQVTQFKLLKRAQNRARTESPLRTSLRSLQALRNSRSLDTDDCLPAHQTSNTDFPSASTNSSDWSHLVRSSSVQKMATREVQRSQSLSPRRVPHCAQRYLSINACVYASPERSTAAAWGGNLLSRPR